jgi:hypothetical protein
MSLLFREDGIIKINGIKHNYSIVPSGTELKFTTSPFPLNPAIYNKSPEDCKIWAKKRLELDGYKVDFPEEVSGD